MTLRLLLIAFMSLACLNLNAKTYYYKLEKIVTDKTPRSASGSGIFITFTNDGCYDSDSQGYTNNHSYLKLAYKGNYTVYNGRTYWGQGDYKFTPDLSRLNVVVNDKVYVYNRITPGSSVTKSTYVGSPKSSGGGSVTMPATPGYGSPNGSGQSHNNSGKMSREWYQSTYNRYANQAADIYNTITTKLVDSNGNTTRGYVYRQQDSQGAIQSMIQNLRKVQRDMRDLRQEASRYGYRLSASTYETIDVKYY